MRASLYTRDEHVCFSSSDVSSHVCKTCNTEDSVFCRRETCASNSMTLLSKTTTLFSPLFSEFSELFVLLHIGGYTGFCVKNVLDVRFSVKNIGVFGVPRSVCTQHMSKILKNKEMFPMTKHTD